MHHLCMLSLVFEVGGLHGCKAVCLTAASLYFIFLKYITDLMSPVTSITEQRVINLIQKPTVFQPNLRQFDIEYTNLRQFDI